MSPQRESLATLSRSLADCIDAGDSFQVGHLLGYCVFGGLASYQPPQTTNIDAIRQSEVLAVHDFLKQTIGKLSSGADPAEVGASLEEQVNAEIEGLRQDLQDATNRSVLLRNMVYSLNKNKGSFSTKIAWDGMVLLDKVSSESRTYRIADTLATDYKLLSETFVRNMSFSYEGRK